MIVRPMDLTEVKRQAPSTRRILLIALLYFLNVYSTKVPYLGLFMTGCSYVAMGYWLLRGKPQEAALLMLLFLTTTMEFDAYIYPGGFSPFVRYNVIKLPVGGSYGFFIFVALIAVMIFVDCRKKGITIRKSSLYLHRFRNWLLLLLSTSIFFACIGMLTNDNEIMNTTLYPIAFYTTTFSFTALCSFMMMFMYISVDPVYRKRLELLCHEMLLSAVIAASVVIAFGWTGYYVNESGLMLMPMVIGLCPVLLLFIMYRNPSYPRLSLFLTLVTLVEGFLYPSVMGSKWYLVILMTAFTYLMMTVTKRNVKVMLLVGVVLLFVIIYASDMMSMVSDSHFVEFKLTQVLDMLNFSKYESISDWYDSLGLSAKFRIDEFINIGIEYWHKPFYMLFGKGLAGTTLHHTTTLLWEAPSGTFGYEQIYYGVYYIMHESVNMIFLRHGIVGLAFIATTLWQLGKRLTMTPWAILGIIWFLFYWVFGYSFWIGAVAMVMTFSAEKGDTMVNVRKLRKDGLLYVKNATQKK